eukprot:jgi/Botrbrau1/19116/Bobra.0077s0029.1
MRWRMASIACLGIVLLAVQSAFSKGEGDAVHRHAHHHSLGHHRPRLDGLDPSARALADVGGEAGPFLPRHFYNRPMEDGVYHFTIPGAIDVPGTGSEPAVMYLYLKGLRRGDDVVTFRGFAWLESTSREWYNWGGTGLCMPQLCDIWVPRIYFRTVREGEPGTEHDFKVFKEEMYSEIAEPAMGTLEERIRVCVPYPIELNLTAQEAYKDFEIRIGGWKNFAYYSPQSIHKPVAQAPPTEELPEVVAILVPFLETTPQDAANALLERYIQYHLKLGFSQFVQYTQSTYLGGFMEDERLRRRVAEGVLRFVLWDSTPECVNHLKCYQPLQYGHAILAHWGRPVRLSMADHDEYFAIPYPANITTIQDVMHQCLGDPVPPQSNFFRYNVRCAECGHLAGFQADGAELELWQQAGGSGTPHPLRHYSLRATNPFQNDRGKCIIDPNRMAGYQVHYGMVFGEPGIDVRQPLDLPQVPKECGFWVHLVNLFKRREVETDSPLGPELLHVPYEDDLRWHWIFQHLREPAEGAASETSRSARRVRHSSLRAS